MRSGAGRDTSGALHHSYVNGLEVEGEVFRRNAFDAEKAIPENAYLSQMTTAPESSRELIRELRTATQSKGSQVLLWRIHGRNDLTTHEISQRLAENSR